MPKPPKYRSIARRLQQEIVAGAYLPGQPMPSEQAMADSYGVNRLTLRKALTVLEAEKLVTRKHGCGTFANPAAERREQARVFFVGETKTHFYGSFYAALCSEAEGLGKAVISCGIGNVEQREALTEMLSGQSSVICMHNHWQRLRDLVPANCRVVLVSGFHSLRRETITGAPNHVVSTDTFHGAMYAVEHLLALGHRQIALLDTAAGDAAMVKAQGFGPVIDSMPTCQGYRAALRQAGLGQEYLIGIPNLESESEEAATDSASQALFRYLEASSSIPSAYLCVGDFRAVAAYRALRQFGLRVPDDVSVIGMGNTPWCTCLDPQLTSVCLGEVELARTALLLSAGTSPAGGRLLRVDPHVVNRNSTARHTV